MVVTFCARMGYEALSAALSVFVVRAYLLLLTDIYSNQHHLLLQVKSVNHENGAVWHADACVPGGAL